MIRTVIAAAASVALVAACAYAFTFDHITAWLNGAFLYYGASDWLPFSPKWLAGLVAVMLSPLVLRISMQTMSGRFSAAHTGGLLFCAAMMAGLHHFVTSDWLFSRDGVAVARVCPPDIPGNMPVISRFSHSVQTGQPCPLVTREMVPAVQAMRRGVMPIERRFASVSELNQISTHAFGVAVLWVADAADGDAPRFFNAPGFDSRSARLLRPASDTDLARERLRLAALERDQIAKAQQAEIEAARAKKAAEEQAAAAARRSEDALRQENLLRAAEEQRTLVAANEARLANEKVMRELRNRQDAEAAQRRQLAFDGNGMWNSLGGNATVAVQIIGSSSNEIIQAVARQISSEAYFVNAARPDFVRVAKLENLFATGDVTGLNAASYPQQIRTVMFVKVDEVCVCIDGHGRTSHQIVGRIIRFDRFSNTVTTGARLSLAV